MSKEDRNWKIATWVFGILFVLAIITNGFNFGGEEKVNNQGNNNPPKSNINANDFVDNDPYLGDKNAKVTIVEFSDFQCPFCGRFRSQTFDQLKREYIDSGKVRFVYRDFPLSSIHPYAQKAAEASECAEDQGKFWEYHDELFRNQGDLSIENLKQIAVNLGLDSNEFNDCLDSGKYANEVKKDVSDAQKAGARGTPFFIVGNRIISGAQPFEVFKSAIDAQL